MKLFNLLFLYFLSSTGFFCYGDSFSNGVVTAQWGAVNPNNYLNGKVMYYVVPAQKWSKLPDEIKIDVFQIDPEQMRVFFNAQGLNEKDMVGHYIGSMGHVEAGVIFGKVKMLDEFYTNMGMENNAFYREAYNGVVIRAFVAGSSMEDATQTPWGRPRQGLRQQWGGQQNWGMNIRIIGVKEPKIRMFGALLSNAGVVDSISVQGIMAKAIGLENMGVDVSYIANTAIETMQGMAGKMMFMKNNTDYVKATMKEKGLRIDMKAPYQNLQFYLVEPIGGGGGAAILASMGIDTQDYAEIAEKIRVTDMSLWKEALKWQKALDNSPADNNSIVWMVVPSQQFLNNPAFYEEFK